MLYKTLDIPNVQMGTLLDVEFIPASFGIVYAYRIWPTLDGLSPVV